MSCRQEPILLPWGSFKRLLETLTSPGQPTFLTCAPAPTSGSCVDLNGGSQGTLQSVSAVTLQPGVNYYLSFDLIGS